jgi:hypothetical protein
MIMGGLNAQFSRQALDNSMIYHIHQNDTVTGEILPRMPEAKGDFGLVFDQNAIIYTAGGCICNTNYEWTALQTCSRYDIEQQKWSSMPFMNFA